MFFIPLGIGIIAGLIVFFTFLLIKKKSKNPFFAKVPGYLGVIASLVLFGVGYFCVRGFQGAAYIMCAIPVFIFAIIVLFKGKELAN